MKTRFNLRVKLFLGVVLIISLVLVILLFQSVSRERKVFQTSFEERAKVLALALDAGIGSFEELKNVSKLQGNIYKFLWLYPDLVELSISTPSLEGLKIVASSKVEEIGRIAGPESLISYEQGKFITKTLTLPDGTKVFSAITPVHIGGIKVGAYEISLSLETEEKAISRRQIEIVVAILVSLIIIIGLLSILLNRMVILPIIEIKKGLEIFGKGDLKYRITPRSEDEIGDVARGFNEMAEKLEKSYTEMEEKVAEATRELEEAKTVLEIKVQARTRELRELIESQEEIIKERTKEIQKRVEELERFQKLAVGRELKMIELKEEIKKLKKELEIYKGRE